MGELHVFKAFSKPTGLSKMREKNQKKRAKERRNATENLETARKVQP